MKKLPAPGEVWYAYIPKEEDPNDLMERPCIVIEEIEDSYLVIKLTRTPPRKDDPYDTRIVYWKECGLGSPSTARVSKVIWIKKSQIDNFKGSLHSTDEARIAAKLNEFLNM